MKTIKHLVIFLFTLTFINCSKDSTDSPQPDPITQTDDDPVVLSSAKELTSFSVLKSDNASLEEDADVQQNGSSLKLFFPSRTDLKTLVIRFQVSGKALLKVGGTVMTSGSSTLDFTDALILTVEAEDGSTKTYNIASEADFKGLDDAIEALRTKYNAPGFQIAITRGERLVYRNVYGNADLNGQEMATNASVYRLASVSKTITAITILKMIEDGILDFDDTVFGSNGILETDYGTTPYGTNIENITVRHLLDHTSGFANNPNDAMFQNLDWTVKQVIDDVLDNRQLATVPGATYSYSNFGYTLLGRVVAKASGMTYEEYVKQSVLNPLGITNMNIANESIDEKWPNEVEYFSQGDGISPYDLNPQRLDAAGGWTASATDLARYLVGIDRRPAVPDLVSAATLGELYFGQDQWGFNGSLPGTSSGIWRLDNDTNFVILTNTRTLPDINEILLDMNSTMSEYIWSRSDWPNYDLF